MNCCIDIGNTRTKIGLFQEGHLEKEFVFESVDSNSILECVSSSSAQNGIISSTNYEEEDFKNSLKRQFEYCIEFTNKTPLPIAITYETPDTLGDDRKAAVVAAQYMQPNTPLLVITAGTCITYNFFDAISFVGGAISPGIYMRYLAMHEFTSQLPLAPNDDFNQLIGKTTFESLQSGVRQGIVQEVQGIIQQYELLEPNLKVFICGGDTNFFVSRIKNKIFAHANLVLYGLNDILEYNRIA